MKLSKLKLSLFVVFSLIMISTLAYAGETVREAKKFNVIECSGTPYEIGKQYGTACKENIRKSIAMHDGAWKHVYKASKEQIIANAKKFLPAVTKFDPDLIEMLKGQAEGAGVSFDEVFALRCMIEFGEYYNQITAMCTSFMATGKATKGGKTIIGQNIDWSPDFPLNLLKIKHPNGLEQLTLAFGGVLEWTMSSAGLGIVENLILSPPEQQRLNIPCGFVIPKAMRQKNIGDALGVFCEAGRGLLYYGLGSGEGDIIGIESTPDDFCVLQPKDDILVHSNHYLTPKFQKGDWVYALGAADSYIRIQRIKRLMKKQYGNITVETMMDALRDHNNYPNAICRHVDKDKPIPFKTVASIIYDLDEKVMYIAYGNPCKYDYVKYGF